MVGRSVNQSAAEWFFRHPPWLAGWLAAWRDVWWPCGACVMDDLPTWCWCGVTPFLYINAFLACQTDVDSLQHHTTDWVVRDGHPITAKSLSRCIETVGRKLSTRAAIPTRLSKGTEKAHGHLSVRPSIRSDRLPGSIGRLIHGMSDRPLPQLPGHAISQPSQVAIYYQKSSSSSAKSRSRFHLTPDVFF